MTRADLQRALIEMGWISMSQRVLGGRPGEAFALWQMIRCAGRLVTFSQFGDEYATGCAYDAKPRLSGAPVTKGAIASRIQRLRTALADIGVDPAVIRSVWGHGYILEAADVPAIKAALLAACGIEVDA